MKSFKNVFAILFVSVILCGCSNSGNGGASVVGTWKMDVEEAIKKAEVLKEQGKVLHESTCEYVFNEDGTGMEKTTMTYESPVDKGVIYKTTIKGSNPFKWRKDGSRLVLEMTDINMEMVNPDAICSNPKKSAEWQRNIQKMADDYNKSMLRADVKNEALTNVNAGGGYDFEILELNENKLELKSAKGDIKKFDKVK